MYLRSASFSVLVAIVLAKNNFQKTRKYKCMEIVDDKDEGAQFSYEKSHAEHRPFNQMKTEMRIPPATPKPVEPSTMPTNIPRDHAGRPLILSPQHCAQVKKYATMYAVTDVLSWVKKNCHFAKLFLPDATCDEVNVLVASCYKNS